MKIKRTFASDNNSGVHPAMWQAMQAINAGHVAAYGDDPYTGRAIAKFKEHFGDHVAVYFTFGGTAANVLSFKTVTHSFNAVICPVSAHIHTSECGAPELFTGCKLLTIPTDDGKINVEMIRHHFPHLGQFDDRDQHHVQPKVISITNATEVGTVYTPTEIKALADFAHAHKLLLHVDGARIANAAASLGVGFREITTDVGVDILSFGGTKNGLLFAEAVVFLNASLAENFKYFRKQGMQLPSKMRYISIQFETYLTNDFWRTLASHANAMARLLAHQLAEIPEVTINKPVEANGVFATLPQSIIPRLQQEHFFYVWDETTAECRLMCSFDTTEEDVSTFVAAVKRLIAES
ncbi:MAG: low specificity L-threonine aldolase [Gemmatimonadetes bacterium]|nr:MAG: low specificity L-threonine aldolase [Gemmatimonadota bacterium]